MSKRILFLTPQLPYPPHQGTALRNYGLIKGLADRGHAITLLSFLEEGQPEHRNTPLADLCDSVTTIKAPSRNTTRRLIDLVSGRVDMARRLWELQFRDTLLHLLTERTFDAIHFEGLEMASYLNTIPQIVKPSTRLIYDAHNAEYALQESIAAQRRGTLKGIYSEIQVRRLRKFEAQVCQTVTNVLACSDVDKQALRQLDASTPVTVIPNAIFVDEYKPEMVEAEEIDQPALVFTGKMDYPPNIDAAGWFAKEILPHIHAQVPEAHFTIVGKNPDDSVLSLQRQPRITVTGAVDAIPPYLKAASVFVIPLRMGSGTRLKLLEAMAMQCAIVSTETGAEGFDLTDEEYLRLADAPEDFAQAVVDLLRDEKRRRELGSRAAQMVSERYDWSVITPALEAVYGSD